MVLSQRVIDQELARRRLAVLAAFTPEAISDGHAPQLLALRSLVQNLILMCSRRAGKTYLCAALLAMTAVKAPGPASCLYLALTSGQAKKVWRKIWKPLCRKWKLCAAGDHNETDMVTTFPGNGATVQFGGTDDLRHVQSLLGDSMACGMAVIDECQSDPGLIERLVTDILGPMLDETTALLPTPGRLVLAGTVPEVAAGYFWDTWKENYDEQAQAPKTDSAWLPIGWGRSDNPHETYFEERLKAYCHKYKFQVTDPIVQRNWYGRRVFDSNATAYKYKPGNAWEWQPDGRFGADAYPPGQVRMATAPPAVNNYAIGLDPAASSDRFAIVVWGWSGDDPKGLWQVGEWVTEKGANALESQYLEFVKACVSRLNVVSIIRDAGSASTTLDPAFLSEHGLVIEPAKKGKGSVKARVDRLKDLLGTGRAHIMAGSSLEYDLQHAQFDQEKRAIGKYEWTAACHPDVADAATYAIPAYIEATAKKVRQVLDPYQPVGYQDDDRLAAEAFRQTKAEYGQAAKDQDQPDTFDDGSSYGGPGVN